MSLPDIRLSTTPIALDDFPMERRVGLLALATDHTSEVDFRRMVASDSLGVYVARVPYANPTTPDTLRGLLPRLAEGAALVLPGEPLNAVYFACTSASVVIGEAAVEHAIRQAKPGVPVVTPTRAARRGLRSLGVKRISLLTPYTPATTAPMLRYFVEGGLDVVSCTCLGLDDDRVMARINAASLIAAAREATAADAEALFFSCTGVRSAAVTAEIEQAISRPIITSNQAAAWMILRLCGDTMPRPQFGRLMACPDIGKEGE